MRRFLKNETMQILLIALTTAIGAEIKVYPFHGDYFRMGLGASTFLFFLLFMRHLPYLKIGIITGIFSVCFQGTEWLTHSTPLSFTASLQNNVAAGVYYIVFALCMDRLRTTIHEYNPLRLGGLVSGIDLISNGAELFLRWLLLGVNVMEWDDWLLLLVLTVVRSYFVIGLYSSIVIGQMRVLHAEKEKRMEQMLHVGTGLYGETFYLQKSMGTIEAITEQSYILYSKLKEENLEHYGREALSIAQQIHEVKKDSQRILAGLTKLYDSEIVVDMSLAEMLGFVVKANEKYSRMFQKKIKFTTDLDADYRTGDFIPLLTIVNNLVSNAVEAIQEHGTISIRVYEESVETVFVVSDTGCGIRESHRGIIFQPGFTTKYNESGVAAAGIGLSHVRNIVHSLGGEIAVGSSEEGTGTTFIVRLSTLKIRSASSAV
ncbi:sensor histidine kinase [Paenibacillus elgii]|uniref:sensor histidine kinase n=1 Tax=Paenibacillus elgii TaxID=189691 RepID=UPI00203F33EC|nr:ATP-binding protein [Paenibacillus elgii]